MVDLVFKACENCSTVMQQIYYFDSLTDVGFGGVIGLVMMILIGGFLFMSMKAFSTEKALGASLFITSILGILAGTMGLLSDNILYTLLVTFAISLFLLIKKQDTIGF